MGSALCDIETPEHELVQRHLAPNSTVLELGGRYGTTTCEIAARQRNSGRLVTVEPDSKVWKILKSNTQEHRCNYTLFKGTVGNVTRRKTAFGYGSLFCTP